MRNPLSADLHSWQRSAIRKAIPDTSQINGDEYLSLLRYIHDIPEKFYCTEAFESYLGWLNEADRKRRLDLSRCLNGDMESISNAFRHMREICHQDWHEEIFPESDEYGKLILIERKIHPVYLRLVEGVLKPLLKPIAYFARIDRGKGTDGLDIHNIADELRGAGFAVLIDGYDAIMRNGIAHGGVIYFDRSIRYCDKIGRSKEVGSGNVVRLTDDIVDTCNALVLSMSIFLISKNRNEYNLPNDLIYDELRAETKMPYWSITGFLPSQNAIGRQLNIYVTADCHDERKVHFSMIQTGVLAEALRPGFDRYFISIKSKFSILSMAAFSGKMMSQYRMNGEPISNYREIVDGDVFFYLPRFTLPKRLRKLHSIFIAYRLTWPVILDSLQEKNSWSGVRVRRASGHRNSWRLIVGGSVVLEMNRTDENDIKAVVRRLARKIIRKVTNQVRRDAPPTSVLRVLPLGYARVSVYRRDFRKRRFDGFGLGKDLICTIQVQNIKGIQAPDIYGSSIEEVGSIRIAWNYKWLKDCGEGVNGAAGGTQ